MAKSIKNTKTEQNLLKAFAGESQARNRYTYFASAARKEGYEQIANIFAETAENEKEHAKVFFKHLEGGDVEITATYPAGVISDTKANLEAAAAGENMEWTTLYANFAKMAKDEGFLDVARSFEQVSKVEKFHEARYRNLINNLVKNEVFKKKTSVKWHCTNCGYVIDDVEAPKECPVFERTGYNLVNTVVYAAIALGALYLIWKFLKRKGFDFASKDFLYGVGAFVLFGSTARVLTDLSDAGHSLGVLSPIFGYGYLTVTPGIYIVTAMLFLFSIAIGRAMKQPRFPVYAGLLLWLPCLLLLIPFMQNFGYFLLGTAIAAAGALVSYFLLKKFAKQELGLHEKLAILGQALDGAATFIVIDVFSKASGKGYFEQHVLSGGIGTATPLGFFLFSP